ncbi:MAG: thiamine biosynthesis protein ThiF [Xanthobacteraceae bacterium]|nr:MAG: thiamine biosynthesis protein ThiF [Xanthobacteraceae bacterium]
MADQEGQGEEGAPLSLSVSRALRLIKVHDSVVGVTVVGVMADAVVVSVRIKTEMPAAWRAAGQSPSGVRIFEDVLFCFDADYPVNPPAIRLRSDFDRAHPHLQPGSADSPPEPCLVIGSPRELLRLRGILGLVDQLVEWVDRAAMVQLIDPEQGWEPVRRDHIDDIVVAEPCWIRGLMGPEGGCKAFPLQYFAALENKQPNYWTILRASATIPLNEKLTDRLSYREHKAVRIGHGLALIAWPSKRPDGSAFVADRWFPETVSTVSELLQRAQMLGCRDHLEAKLTLLQSRLAKLKTAVPLPLIVMLLARRPYKVIKTHSEIELCPYLIEIDGGDDLSSASTKPVRIVAHRDDISTNLLRQASGDDALSNPAAWALIGCGSVGSKLAIHMARAGRAPSSLIDRGWMSPHNFARHAVFPGGANKDFGLVDSKVNMVGEACEELGSKPARHSVDVVTHMQAHKSLASLVADNAFAIVNATGSATVREVLGAEISHTRVVEVCLLGIGGVGMMTIEGPGQNPSSTDLICECYRHIWQSTDLADEVFRSTGETIALGQGCSAITLPLTDSRISMFSAPFTEKLIKLQADGMPDVGALILGRVQADGLSQAWTQTPVEPRIIVPLQSGNRQVRISPAVERVILEEIAKKPKSENGGIIYGRFCDITESFHVVGTLPAPPDSKFSKHEFVLGTKGLRPMLDKLIKGSGGALYPLGTWHNHLVPSEPSTKDMNTAALLSGMQFFPLLMLIHTPGGYSVLTIETIDKTENNLSFKTT